MNGDNDILCSNFRLNYHVNRFAYVVICFYSFAFWGNANILTAGFPSDLG